MEFFKCPICGTVVRFSYACGEYFMISDCEHVPPFFHTNLELTLRGFAEWHNDIKEE